MQKNITGQKWIVFAFDRTDNTPKTGDANQITAEISKDGAVGGGDITDTHPTELEDGYYVFGLEQGETNADLLAILPESSTGNIQVIGVPGAVYTTPAGFPDNAMSQSKQDAVVMVAGYLGDFELGDTIHFGFSTITTITPNSEALKVYKDDGDTPLTTAQATLDPNVENGFHQVSVVLGAANYDKESDYQVVLEDVDVGTATIAAVVIATFSVQNRYQEPVHRQVAK